MSSKPVVLVILDGWGVNSNPQDNAIAAADKPVWDNLVKTCPYVTLGASGEAVGLPQGQMGNSEVGHLNLGAGRIVYQQITRIDKDIREDGVKSNPALKDLASKVKASGGKIHLWGLLSDGGVHSHQNHLHAFLDFFKASGVSPDKVFVHTVLDGRDTPPRSAEGYLKALEKKLSDDKCGRVATVSGRYYAMDRDKRWERVLLAWKIYIEGAGLVSSSSLEALKTAYDRNENDEFVTPTVITEQGRPLALMEDGDGVLFFNFRPDRGREICQALVMPEFNGFVRSKTPKLEAVCLSQYDKSFGLPVAYPPQELKNILTQVVSGAGKRQLRIAETEKYAHVTFFFNGQVEAPYPNEDRVLIPSPKVATYDLQPEMSAYAVTDRVIQEIGRGIYDMIILNFANCDMVGHTGVMEAAVKAVQSVDTCLGEVLKAVAKAGGEALVTADHGNAELMKDPVTHQPHTAHTTNPVPLIYSGPRRLTLAKDGVLADVAPTILNLMGLPVPSDMDGRCLIKA
jgi:2,3-bisphosphoglycerate-independent phosphoglycerate mutase